MAGFFGIGARSGAAGGSGGAEREGRDGGVARPGRVELLAARVCS